MPIELVLVDVTGTLTTDAALVARTLCDSLRAHNVDVDVRRVLARMGRPKRAIVRELLAERRGGAAVPERDVELVHTHFAHRMLRHYRQGPGPILAPGAAEALARLGRADRRVVLTTGFDRAVSVALEACLGLVHRGLATSLLTAEDGGEDGEGLFDAARRLVGVDDPARVAVVGDTVTDLARGVRAGAGLVVGVTSGAGAKADLAAVRGAELVAQVAELPARIVGPRFVGPRFAHERVARAG